MMLPNFGLSVNTGFDKNVAKMIKRTFLGVLEFVYFVMENVME